jgi:hypothetical protein
MRARSLDGRVRAGGNAAGRQAAALVSGGSLSRRRSTRNVKPPGRRLLDNALSTYHMSPCLPSIAMPQILYSPTPPLAGFVLPGLAITDEASPFALRSTRNHPRRAVQPNRSAHRLSGPIRTGMGPPTLPETTPGPAFALVSLGVEPPAGIEPATPYPYHRCAGGSRRRSAPHVATQPRSQRCSQNAGRGVARGCV